MYEIPKVSCKNGLISWLAPLATMKPRIPNNPSATICLFLKIRNAFHSNVRPGGREGSFRINTIGIGMRVITASEINTACQLASCERTPTVADINTIPSARPATMMPCTVPSSSLGVVSSANPSVQVSYIAIPVSERNATMVSRTNDSAGLISMNTSCPPA